MNMMDLLNEKNLKKMEESLLKMQEKYKKIEVTGESGGGIVKITLNGQYECTKIFIDPIAIDPRDVNMLKTLLKSAYFSAWQKIKDKLPDNSLSNMMSQMPSMFKK